MPSRHAALRTTPQGGHLPVLPKEVLKACAIRPNDIVVDCTVGMGGHSLALLPLLGSKGKLIAIDRDATVLAKVRQRLSDSLESCAQSRDADSKPQLLLQHANFAALPAVVGQEGLQTVDVVLADLGVSSMQIDDGERGFSYARPGPLDMRMDASNKRTAAELVAELSEAELASSFGTLGDEPQAAAIAAAIVRARKRQPIRTTDALVAIVLAATVDLRTGRPNDVRLHRGNRTIVARVFQALRILVNRELAALETLLRCVPPILAPGGRFVVISFHSGEDRLVKDSFRDGRRGGIYSGISDEPIRASEDETLANPRSRSAKLRWAVKAG